MSEFDPAAEARPDGELPAGPLIATLVWGFRAALAALLVGLTIALARDEPIAPRVQPLGDIGSGLLAGQAAALIDSGIVLLLLTPVAAVAVVLIQFVLRRDWTFVLIALAVLGALVSGIALAFR